MKKHKDDSSELREARDMVVKDYNEAQKKLEVLTEFFNKKEAELQKQIGLQSAKFGDLNTDAESTTKRLEIVNEDLKKTREDLQSKKKELENQEKLLKASVGDQEKKAHECWVAARQAERKVNELQSETSILKNRLTVAENKNFNLEKEKGELEGTIKSIKSSVKSESGADSCSVTSDSNMASSISSLPPLPGLNTTMSNTSMMPPGLGSLMLPGMMSMRPAPLGEISPSPRTTRRSHQSRSPSPDSRYRENGGYVSPRSQHRQRDHSPARSERSVRSDREYHRDAYRPHRRDNSGDRGYYRDRYRRDESPRSDRSRYSERDNHDYRDHRAPSHSGPITSSPTSANFGM